MNNPKWIHAEERLPPSGTDVFILCEDSERMTGDREIILSLQKSGYRDILWLDESGLEKDEQAEGKGTPEYQFLEFTSAHYKKGFDHFSIWMKDDNGKSYVTEFDGKFGRLLFAPQLVKKAANVREVLEMLLEGWGDEWTDHTKKLVEKTIAKAKNWTEETPDAPPSAETGEQVGGRAFENISRIIHPATESTDRTLPFAPPSVEVDQQVPEEIKAWLESSVPHWAKYDAGCGQSFIWKNGAFAMYRKMMEEISKANTRYSDTILDLRKAEAANATLKESFKSSIYQHDQDMEIVKGERDELKMWQAVAKASISRLETEIEALVAERTAYRDLLEELKKAKTYVGIDRIIAAIPATLNKFTNNTKDA